MPIMTPIDPNDPDVWPEPQPPFPKGPATHPPVIPRVGEPVDLPREDPTRARGTGTRRGR